MANRDEIANFSLAIEKLAREKNTSYMDAIILHCEQTGFEIELDWAILEDV